jgi:hypothetical protein
MMVGLTYQLELDRYSEGPVDDWLDKVVLHSIVGLQKRSGLGFAKSTHTQSQTKDK